METREVVHQNAPCIRIERVVVNDMLNVGDGFVEASMIKVSSFIPFFELGKVPHGMVKALTFVT